jgi:hypothetical protein
MNTRSISIIVISIITILIAYLFLHDAIQTQATANQQSSMRLAEVERQIVNMQQQLSLLRTDMEYTAVPAADRGDVSQQALDQISHRMTVLEQKLENSYTQNTQAKKNTDSSLLTPLELLNDSNTRESWANQSASAIEQSFDQYPVFAGYELSNVNCRKGRCVFQATGNNGGADLDVESLTKIYNEVIPNEKPLVVGLRSTETDNGTHYFIEIAESHRQLKTRTLKYRSK